jgi:two-component system response regulator RegA
MKDYKTLLIIEDDKDLANSLGKSFEKRNYQVLIANNIKDALDSLTKFHPRYAVIDLKLGKESGLDCIKHIHEFDASIKIVMLTAYASITSTIEAIKFGALYYLAKPSNVDDIISAFNEIKLENKNNDFERKTSIKNIEWEYINQTLVACDFNITKTAKTLGIHRRTLARKLAKRRLHQ